MIHSANTERSGRLCYSWGRDGQLLSVCVFLYLYMRVQTKRAAHLGRGSKEDVMGTHSAIR